MYSWLLQGKVTICHSFHHPSRLGTFTCCQCILRLTCLHLTRLNLLGGPSCTQYFRRPGHPYNFLHLKVLTYHLAYKGQLAWGEVVNIPILQNLYCSNMISGTSQNRYSHIVMTKKSEVPKGPLTTLVIVTIGNVHFGSLLSGPKPYRRETGLTCLLNSKQSISCPMFHRFVQNTMPLFQSLRAFLK